MNLAELRERVESNTARLAVIGLGYVGLPVACVFAEHGFDVLGVEIKPERVALINDGNSPIEGDEPGLADLLAHVVESGRLRATSDYAALRDRDIILIAVETPVNDEHLPEYIALQTVCRGLGPVLKTGALVIVESTIAPGTMDRVVRPLLQESSGGMSGSSFFLGTCPERVMPGKLLANLQTVSRVCGGETLEAADVMVALYRYIVDADLDPTDCVTAELVKTTENAFRDVNIAFANEVALICEAVGGDVWRVRELVNKSPGRNMHFPGAGVGGHCIPKDPWLLASAVENENTLSLIPAARKINDSMPLHIMTLLEDALTEMDTSLYGARVAVMGYAYLEDSDDTRNSPSARLVESLIARGAEVIIHDPWVPEHEGAVLDCVRGTDAVVFMVAHSAYASLELTLIRRAMRTRILIDGRHIFDSNLAANTGFVYRCVGVGT